ncbi:PHA/PHB synthase family protein [Yoonia maritima]|uniref:PHA/PHB synthase family protein n=1 Tax=Yoonia maritima TaxID=1435347 RepID=UPI00373667E0
MDETVKKSPDAAFHAAIGKLTGGLSPVALASAFWDWSLHLAGSPGRQAELALLARDKAIDLMTDHLDGADDPKTDKRFTDKGWDQYPFNIYRDTFLAQQAWWEAATTDLKGVDPKHERIVSFGARQWLDMVSPTNFALTNPTVQRATVEEKGKNFSRGLHNWIDDLNQFVGRKPATCEGYCVGENVAITKGDVIVKNDLMELIRYTPTQKEIRPEPILIVPAWIMKYYILDLSPENSLVKYLCDQGFEVFMISWKNPQAEDADFTLQDYLDLGIRAACKAIHSLGKRDKIHAVGYCLGGTLLSIAASAMARDGVKCLKTISLLASQVDFSEPGEIGLFINDSQVAFLEDIMATQGYLSADQMAGAFKMLRSNDLVWSRVIRHYLLGERTKMNDLMAWNADSTRMPAAMHSQYLRQLFLENRLARGRFKVDGKSVALSDIRAPIFCVATEKDHIAPWHSVYKLLPLTDTDVTFLLTNGGHNGGILSEPGHPHRHYRMRHKREGGAYTAAEDWQTSAPLKEGSWWPAWVEWLKSESGKAEAVSSLKLKSLGPAPGEYVRG